MTTFFFSMGFGLVQAVSFTRHSGCPHGVCVYNTFKRMSDGTWYRVRERSEVFESRRSAIASFNSEATLSNDPEMLANDRPADEQVARCVDLELHNIDRRLYYKSLS